MGIGKETWAAVLLAFAMLCGSDAVGDEEKKDDIEELKAMWKSQKTEIAAAHIKYRLFQWGASGLLPLGADQVKKIVRSKDLAARPDDMRIIVNKLLQQPHPSPTPWTVNDFYYEGAKSKNARHGSISEVQLLTGKEQVEYSHVNSSAMIFTGGGSRRHMRSIREFREIPNPEAKYEIEEKNANLWFLRSDSVLLVIDPSTGILHERDYYVNGKIIKQDIQMSFLSYPSGIVFPSLSARVTYDSNGILYAISLSWVEDAEFNIELPSDTFSVGIPGKTNVFDNRTPSHVRTFPLAGPTDDVVKMADTREQPVTNRLQNRHHRTIWWIIGNIVLFVLCIGVLLWRRFRLRHS